MNLDLMPHTIHKISSHQIEDINVRTTPLILLEENIEANFHDFALGNDFLNTAPKASAKKKKVNKLDFIKFKNFCALKDSIKKM